MTTPLTQAHPTHSTLTDRPSSARVRFAATVLVESRKIIDTRAGFWLTIALAVSTALVVGGRALLTDAAIGTAFFTSGIVLSTLLPAIGVVSMASEFGSRTALSTFVLEPRRGRVLVAKVLPLIGLAVASSALALVVAVAAGNAAALARGQAIVWSLSLAELGASVLIVTLLMMAGMALGLMLLNIPLALVLLLPSTMFWSAVSIASETGARLREWLDLGTATRPLMDGVLDQGQLARLAVAIMINIVLPAVVGTVRVLRREVK